MRHLAYAPDEHGRRIEQTITLAILRAGDGARLSYARLQEWLDKAQPQDLNDALTRLVMRGIVRLDGNLVEAANGQARRLKIDRLAAVVLHVLVTARHALTVPHVAKECERDYARPKEREEVELALGWLAEDELASRDGSRWLATRPAIRAAELSF